MRNDVNILLGEEHRCPMCRKKFHVRCRPSEWGYAVGARLCCSYTCMKEYSRADDSREYERKQHDMGFRMYQDYCRGMTYSAIARKYQRSLTTTHCMISHLEAMYPKVAERIRREIREEGLRCS